MDHERNIRPIVGALEMSGMSLSRTSSISENLDNKDSDSDGSRLYKTCNAIIASIDSALIEETGWAQEDTTTTVRLREVALSLKHWKTSVRWCAPGEDKTKGEGAVELQIYELLKREDRILLKTIETYMDEVSENLEDIRTFFTNNKRGDSMSKESLKTAFLEELETSVYCLSLQLIPLRTLAELKIKPRASITPETESQRSSTGVSKTRGNIETDLTPLGVSVTARRGLRPKSDFLETEEFELLGASKRRKISEASQIEAIDLSDSTSPDRVKEELQLKSFEILDYEILRIDWLSRSPRIKTAYKHHEDIPQISAQQQSKLAQAAHMSISTLPRQYRYSRISKNQTRLLLVMPGKPEDPLDALLLTIDDHHLRSTKYPYSALSYVWDDEKKELPVVIRNAKLSLRGIYMTKGKGHILIRPNLYEALRYLRQFDTTITLWVSYLCIDWSNTQERSEQPQKTPDIFRNAYNVCAWLGTRSSIHPTFNSVEKFVIKIIEANMGLQSWIREDTAVRWKELIELLKTSWFTCRWVIQEIALAQNVTIHWGPTIIDWSDLQDVISILSNRLEPCTQDLTKWSILDNNKDLADFSFEDCNASLLVKLTSGLFREDYKFSSKSTKDLETLVCLSSGFVCRDPRDTIYALRNLASDFHGDEEKSLVPDYNKDTLQAYRDFIIWVAKRSQSLDILCRHWASPDPILKLPSWIGLVNYSKFARHEERSENDDLRVSFVGLPGETFYHACGVGKMRKPPDVFLFWRATPKNLPEVGLPRLKYNHMSFLAVRGGVIGIVDDTVPFSGIASRVHFRMLGHDLQDTSDSGYTVPDIVWRTLVADRTSDGKALPTYYRRACLDSLIHHADAKGHIEIEKALQNSEGIRKEYLARVKDVTSGRILIKGISISVPMEHLVGLGPRETKLGDMIVILYGCSVPVILRRLPSDPGLESEYELVGEAYFHGCMEGEALRGIVDEVFRLV